MANPTNRPMRKGRPNYPLEFKRTLAQRACEPGVSVAKLAQEHGINANVEASVPVAVVDTPVQRASPESSPLPVTPVVQRGIEIAFGDCTVRVGKQADPAALRAVLALLRR